MAHDSYKSPQSPSYKSYHNISQQPYKIPSQSGNRFRQQSPPHLSVAGSNSGVCGKSMSFQQQQANVAAAAIKEMYRSNSLPINASIQMPIQTHNKEIPPDQFVVPKYHIKNKNSRSRSNSINYKQGSLLPALQSAASEPSLNANSALAQLLTNTSSSSLLASCKSTNSVIHSLPQRANSANQINFTVNQTMPSTEVINFQQQKAAKPSTSSTASCGSGSSFTYTPTLSPDSAFHDNDLSPERSTSVASKGHPRENQRRAGHIHAEQKRRYNIKNGFDMLHSLIPQLQQNPNAKLSKASMLQKGAEYIKQLRLERASINEQMEGLRKEIDTLTNSLK